MNTTQSTAPAKWRELEKLDVICEATDEVFFWGSWGPTGCGGLTVEEAKSKFSILTDLRYRRRVPIPTPASPPVATMGQAETVKATAPVRLNMERNPVVQIDGIDITLDRLKATQSPAASPSPQGQPSAEESAKILTDFLPKLNRVSKSGHYFRLPIEDLQQAAATLRRLAAEVAVLTFRLAHPNAEAAAKDRNLSQSPAPEAAPVAEAADRADELLLTRNDHNRSSTKVAALTRHTTRAVAAATKELESQRDTLLADSLANPKEWQQRAERAEVALVTTTTAAQNWQKKYYDVAVAVCRESTQARKTHADLRAQLAEKDVTADKINQLLYRIGVCPVCEQEIVHELDAPFTNCGCRTSEDTGKPPLIQQLRISLAEKDTEIAALKIEVKSHRRARGRTTEKTMIENNDRFYAIMDGLTEFTSNDDEISCLRDLVNTLWAHLPESERELVLKDERVLEIEQDAKDALSNAE